VFDKIKRTQCLQYSRILVFEGIATAILVYGVMGSQYTAEPYPHPENYKPAINLNHSIYQSSALFLALCFSGQLTGAHCNPAVTLALWICQGSRLKLSSALLYFVSQFAGALIGGLCAWGLVPTF
jgi:glycerol uptake facilitator-like aquaporin